MENGRSLREMDDRFSLPYRHRRVTQIRVDHALTLLLEGHVSVAVEQRAPLSVGPIRAPAAEVLELAP